jgi:hypothetical protein
MSFQYINNIFKDLIDKYPSWNEFSSYIESNEGGLFRIIDKNENGLCIIRYEKGVSNMTLPHSKWFRSVVWDTRKNIPVCIAPPKAVDEFRFNTFDDLINDGIVCQEYLEGVMINCFKLANDDTIYITSRSKLDAAGKFYSEKTFKELFMEAYSSTYDDVLKLESPKDVNEYAIFYSFLVQHKEHRIVKNIDKNNVYLIHRGVVYNDLSVKIDDSPSCQTCNIPSISFDDDIVKGSYAEIVSRLNNTDNQVLKWVKNKLFSESWQFQGIVFKDKTGNRWRFRSEKYAAVRALRGNSSNIVERFSQLYCQALVNKYLEYYPDECIPMTTHMMFMNSIIRLLHHYYTELHITKTITTDKIDKMYLPHLYNIHGMYLSKLRPENKRVDLVQITLYIHKQPWQRIAFLIKKAVQNINSEV